MTLIRWQPLRELEPVSSMMRRFFNDFESGFPSLEVGNFVPCIDVSEDDKNVFVHVELPGMQRDEVKITVNDENVLTIRGEKKREQKTDGKNYYRLERSFGEFVRSFTLPAEVNADSIEAKFDKGILSITLPKHVPARLKEHEIKIS